MLIGNESKKRNSEHEISDEDMRDLNLDNTNNITGTNPSQERDSNSKDGEVKSAASEEISKRASSMDIKHYLETPEPDKEELPKSEVKI